MATNAIDLSHCTFSWPCASIHRPWISTSSVGANGAGKSTLLRLIGGRRKRSSSVANVFGKATFEHTALTLRVQPGDCRLLG